MEKKNTFYSTSFGNACTVWDVVGLQSPQHFEAVGRCNHKRPSELPVKPLGWASLGQTNHKGRRCFGFKPGDNDVMVDRGLDISKIVPDGVSVNMPPFLADGNKWLRRKLSRQRVLGQCAFTWSVQSTELHCPTHLVHMPRRYQWSVGYWQTFFHLCWSQLKSHFMCLYHDATNFCSLWPGNVM